MKSPAQSGEAEPPPHIRCDEIDDINPCYTRSLSMLRTIINWNISVCGNIERLLPGRFYLRPSLKRRHTLSVVEKMNAAPSQIVLDVGGGYVCPFVRMRRQELATKFYMADISESQLRNNSHADERVVFDASQNFPFRDGTIDVFVTRTLLEHLSNNETLIRESGRIVRRGGHVIHIFPCKFAPFAVLNQILPNALSKKLLGLFFPMWKGEVGFESYYRNCYFPKFHQLLRLHGFEIEKTEFNYYQSIYFRFFVPFYVVSIIYDLTLWTFGLKPLCCEILVVARNVRSSEMG